MVFVAFGIGAGGAVTGFGHFATLGLGVVILPRPVADACLRTIPIVTIPIVTIPIARRRERPGGRVSPRFSTVLACPAATAAAAATATLPATLARFVLG